MLQIKSAIFHVCIVFAIVAGLLSPAPAWAAAPSRTDALLTLDPAHTTIHFTLPTVMHTVHGTFRLKSGTIKIDLRTRKASGEIIIDAASGQSGNRMRDTRMKDSILEVAKYPEIRFVPNQVRIDGPRQGQFHASLTGTFFLHGSGHEVTLDAVISRTNDNFTMKTRFVVPYVRWGVKDPSVLFLTVSKQVDIDVTGAGHVTWVSQAAAASRPSGTHSGRSHS